MKTRIIPFCVLSMLLGTVCIANAADSNTQNTIVKEYLMQDTSYPVVGYIRAVAVNHLGEVVKSSSFTLLSDGRYYFIDAGMYSQPIKVVNSSLRGFRYSFYAQGSWWYFN